MSKGDVAGANSVADSSKRHRRRGVSSVLRSVAARLIQLDLFLLVPAIFVLAFAANLPRTATALALAWIAFLWLCRFIVRGRLSVSTPVDLPIALILVLLPLNLFASVDLGLSMPTLLRIVGEVTILYAVVNWATSPTQVRALSMALIGLSLGVVVVSLAMTNWSSSKLFDVDQWTRFLPRIEILQLNPEGLNPNVVAGLGAVLLPLAVAQLVWGPDRALRLTGLVGIVVFGAALVLTQSRGAWIALGMAVVGMCILAFRRYVLLLTFVIGAVVVGLFVCRLQPILDLLSAGTTLATAAGRVEGWQRAIQMIRDFPMTGIGLGTFSKVASILYPFFLLGPDSQVYHTHNIYLQAGVDQGIPGMVAYVGLLTALFVTGIRSVRRAHDTRWRGLTLGLMGSLLVFLTHGMLDMIVYGLKASALVWALLGLLVATAQLWSAKAPTSRNLSQPLSVEQTKSPLQNHAAWLVKVFADPAQTIVLWVIVSLLAMTIIRIDTVLGLTLIILGGVAIGLKSFVWYEQQPDLMLTVPPKPHHK